MERQNRRSFLAPTVSHALRQCILHGRGLGRAARHAVARVKHGIQRRGDSGRRYTIKYVRYHIYRAWYQGDDDGIPHPHVGQPRDELAQVGTHQVECVDSPARQHPAPAFKAFPPPRFWVSRPAREPPISGARASPAGGSRSRSPCAATALMGTRRTPHTTRRARSEDQALRNNGACRWAACRIGTTGSEIATLGYRPGIDAGYCWLDVCPERIGRVATDTNIGVCIAHQHHRHRTIPRKLSLEGTGHRPEHIVDQAVGAVNSHDRAQLPSRPDSDHHDRLDGDEAQDVGQSGEQFARTTKRRSIHVPQAVRLPPAIRRKPHHLWTVTGQAAPVDATARGISRALALALR